MSGPVRPSPFDTPHRVSAHFHSCPNRQGAVKGSSTLVGFVRKVLFPTDLATGTAAVSFGKTDGAAATLAIHATLKSFAALLAKLPVEIARCESRNSFLSGPVFLVAPGVAFSVGGGHTK